MTDSTKKTFGIRLMLISCILFCSAFIIPHIMTIEKTGGTDEKPENSLERLEERTTKKYGITPHEATASLLRGAGKIHEREGRFKEAAEAYASADRAIKEGVAKEKQKNIQKAQKIAQTIQNAMRAERVRNILFGVAAVAFLSGIILIASTKGSEASTQ